MSEKEPEAMSEELQRAAQDLHEAINDLSADYTLLGKAGSAFEWLRAIDRCEKDALNVSVKFVSLKEAILKEPFKPGEGEKST